MPAAPSFVSTLAVTVDGVAWTEVDSFFDQPATAAVFVVDRAADGTSSVRFGDGSNGARLPTGAAIVASYRYGAGAAAPPAGRLTTIRNPQPNLAAIRNPVGVAGGADAEPPADVRRNATATVLTFGRAISADDYAAVAAQAPGVTRAQATWSWDGTHQRALVKVFVGDDANAVQAAQSALAGAGDPNRRVAVEQAVPVELAVAGTLVVAADRTPADVAAAATAALADLFSPARMGIGQSLYTSEIEAALLVDGAAAVHSLSATTAGGADVFAGAPVGVAVAGPSAFYALARADIFPVAADA